MSAIQPLLHGARVLDLFAGSGALGLEALSRGAEDVTFVEQAGAALRVLRRNVERLGAEDRVEIVRADALSYLDGLEPRRYDLILADPPYGGGAASRVAEIFASRGLADWLWVEHQSSEPIPEIPGSRTRRYGDTALTSIPAPN